jgi:hypothetical protein
MNLFDPILIKKKRISKPPLPYTAGIEIMPRSQKIYKKLKKQQNSSSV